MKVLEGAVYNRLTKTPAEAKLVARSRQIYLTEKLVAFSLTPEEWQEYQFNPTPDLTFFESFYREADARDNAMARNLLSAFSQIKPRKTGSVGILVTGGYHAPGLTIQLTKAGATVISFVPKIEKVDTADGQLALGIFTQEKTPLQKLFAGEKLFLGNDPLDASAEGISIPAQIAMAANRDPKSTLSGLMPNAVLQKIVSIKKTANALKLQMNLGTFSVSWNPQAPIGQQLTTAVVMVSTAGAIWAMIHTVLHWLAFHFLAWAVHASPFFQLGFHFLLISTVLYFGRNHIEHQKITIPPEPDSKTPGGEVDSLLHKNSVRRVMPGQNNHLPTTARQLPFNSLDRFLSALAWGLGSANGLLFGLNLLTQGDLILGGGIGVLMIYPALIALQNLLDSTFASLSSALLIAGGPRGPPDVDEDSIRSTSTELGLNQFHIVSTLEELNKLEKGDDRLVIVPPHLLSTLAKESHHLLPFATHGLTDFQTQTVYVSDLIFQSLDNRVLSWVQAHVRSIVVARERQRLSSSPFRRSSFGIDLFLPFRWIQQIRSLKPLSLPHSFLSSSFIFAAILSFLVNIEVLLNHDNQYLRMTVHNPQERIKNEHVELFFWHLSSRLDIRSEESRAALTLALEQGAKQANVPSRLMIPLTTYLKEKGNIADRSLLLPILLRRINIQFFILHGYFMRTQWQFDQPVSIGLSRIIRKKSLTGIGPHPYVVISTLHAGKSERFRDLDAKGITTGDKKIIEISISEILDEALTIVLPVLAGSERRSLESEDGGIYDVARRIMERALERRGFSSEEINKLKWIGAAVTKHKSDNRSTPIGLRELLREREMSDLIADHHHVFDRLIHMMEDQTELHETVHMLDPGLLSNGTILSEVTAISNAMLRDPSFDFRFAISLLCHIDGMNGSNPEDGMAEYFQGVAKLALQNPYSKDRFSQLIQWLYSVDHHTAHRVLEDVQKIEKWPIILLESQANLLLRTSRSTSIVRSLQPGSPSQKLRLNSGGFAILQILELLLLLSSCAIPLGNDPMILGSILEALWQKCEPIFAMGFPSIASVSSLTSLGLAAVFFLHVQTGMSTVEGVAKGDRDSAWIRRTVKNPLQNRNDTIFQSWPFIGNVGVAQADGRPVDWIRKVGHQLENPAYRHSFAYGLAGLRQRPEKIWRTLLSYVGGCESGSSGTIVPLQILTEDDIDLAKASLRRLREVGLGTDNPVHIIYAGATPMAVKKLKSLEGSPSLIVHVVDSPVAPKGVLDPHALARGIETLADFPTNVPVSWVLAVSPEISINPSTLGSLGNRGLAGSLKEALASYIAQLIGGRLRPTDLNTLVEIVALVWRSA